MMEGGEVLGIIQCCPGLIRMIFEMLYVSQSQETAYLAVWIEPLFSQFQTCQCIFPGPGEIFMGQAKFR